MTVPFILSLGVGVSAIRGPGPLPRTALALWAWVPSAPFLPCCCWGDLQVMAKLFAGFTQTIVDVTLAFYP